jgi:hypothetical protein
MYYIPTIKTKITEKDWSWTETSNWLCNQRMAILPCEKLKHTLTYVMLTKEDKLPDCLAYFPPPDNLAPAEYKHIIQELTRHEHKPYDCLILNPVNNPDCEITLNRSFVDLVLMYYSEAEPQATDKFHPVYYYQGAELVALIMPIDI